MAVVINDFEVVPPQERDRHSTEGAATGPSSADREALAEEVEQQMRVRREREERLHAC